MPAGPPLTPTLTLARHSRLVQVLRLVLPLGALVMLSLLFLLAQPLDPERAIAQSSLDVLERARDPRVTGAQVAGVTPEGAAIRLSAEVVRSDPLAILRFEANGLELQIDGPSGEALEARSRQGVMDRGTGQFSMSGDVQIRATPGYMLHSPEVSGLLDQTFIEAAGPVEGVAPAGSITAGGLTVTHQPDSEDGDGAHVLLFTGGVRLIYIPQTRNAPP